MSDDLVLLVGSANAPLPYIAQSKGSGISAYVVDGATGTSRLLAICGEVLNPTFIDVSADGTRIAAVTERGDSAFGALTILNLDRQTGQMSTIGSASSMGAGAAHCSFDMTGTRVATANYSGVPVDVAAGASVAAYEVGKDGARLIGTATQTGRGPNADRQERSHAHCARWSPDGRFLIVADLGTDELVSYALRPHGLERVNVLMTPPGSGPRHLAFHPNGQLAYLVSELTSTLISLAYAPDRGHFSVLGADTTLPPGGVAGSTGSGVQVTPDGTQVLVGNRGHDSVARLGIGSDGIARLVATTPCGGRVPRDLAVDPTGRLVAAANQESDHVTLFRIEHSGLVKIGEIATGSPTGVKFVRRG